MILCSYTHTFAYVVSEISDHLSYEIVDHHDVVEYYAQCGQVRSCRKKGYHTHSTNFGRIAIFVHDAFIHPTSRMAYCYETCDAAGFAHRIHPSRISNISNTSNRQKIYKVTRRTVKIHSNYCNCDGCSFRFSQEIQNRRGVPRQYQGLNPIWSGAIWRHNRHKP